MTINNKMDDVFSDWTDSDPKPTFFFTAEEEKNIDEEIKRIDELKKAVLPKSVQFPPIATEDELIAIKQLYTENPILTDDAWVQTYTGKRFFPLHIVKQDICIEDIAHALSMQCRFTGHCKEFYSVAQHSVLTSYLCDDANCLEGLLHDGSEAYIADISSPIKKLPQLSGYIDIERRIQNAIYQKYGISEESKDVKKADLIMLGIEAKSLMNHISPEWKFAIKSPPFKIDPLSPKEAEKLFMDRYIEITSK